MKFSLLVHFNTIVGGPLGMGKETRETDISVGGEEVDVEVQNGIFKQNCFPDHN